MNNNILYTIYTNFLNIQLETYNIQNIQQYYESNNKLQKKEVHLIGIFDKSLKIWYNSWSLNNYSGIGSTNLAKELLIYFIKSEANINNNIIWNIIKSIVCNSKIYITENKTQLQLIIAIYLYFTKKDMFRLQKLDNLFYVFIYDKKTLL